MASLTQNWIGSAVKTKNIERIIVPTAAQISHLIILSQWQDISDDNFSDLEPTAKEVAKATEELVFAAKRLVTDSVDDLLKKEMGPALEFAAMSGKGILMAAQKLAFQPALSEHRNELITSAQNILQGVMQILLTADDVEVRRIVQAAHWLLDCLTLVESARVMAALLAAFREFSEALLLLNNLMEGRLQELNDTVQQQHLNQALEILKKCVPILHTATYTFVKYPKSDQAQAAKAYATRQIDVTVSDIIALLKSSSSGDEAHNKGGLFAHRLHQLLNILSKSKRSLIADSNFDSLVEGVVFHCMIVANASRETVQHKLVTQCQRLLQLRTQISDHCKLLVSLGSLRQLQMDFDTECDAMTKELERLDQCMDTTILYQIVDIFTETKEPLERLTKVVSGSPTPTSHLPANVHVLSLQPFVTSFLTHTDNMIKVGDFTSACCTQLHNFKSIQASIRCLKHLREDTMAVLTKLSRGPQNPELLERLHLLNKHWAHETEDLLASLDAVINVHEFIELSVQKILDDMEECEKHICDQNFSQFTQNAVNLSGRAKRVAQIAKRYLDKSDDPIFRNALLVLINQLESAIPPIRLATNLCLGDLADISMRANLLKKIQQLIDLIYTVRDGIDGINHHKLLHPLRAQARKHEGLKEINYLNHLDFSLIDTKNPTNPKTSSFESQATYLSRPLTSQNLLDSDLQKWTL
ncbi:uncharacterized protein LOC103178933 [Callorhinchus milii]|uniref:Catenin alpha-2-like n=1 Tax=Callorhinchus milii TaxID=7868 RepID=A0A4W3J4S0_CALMI|nr:uncharacterized protein LOC103178933 [Callorhinchus milii]XP_007892116.1 uncharacterized protein LOC103178933 [Callorhinchus milii]|eukprot:gi/632952917/ref/XP_007892115.1/ PREDICTED: catenin alpha-2-like [Callorhinchus milii]